jgi:segregation and condensation protein B
MGPAKIAAAARPPVGGESADRDELLSRLEAVLLLAQNPLSSRKLAQLAALADGTKARTLVRILNRLYDAEGSAFRVEEVAGGFQLLTRARFAPWLRRLHAAAAEVRLSTPAMETLAVVAYRQPVMRTEIEAIRGVQCDEVLRQLVDRDLVRIVGRSEELGRPLLYGTTRLFLQVFGLRHLDELPRAEALRNTKLDDPARSADNQTTTPLHDSPKAEEEMTVKTLVSNSAVEEVRAAHSRNAVVLSERAAKDDLDADDLEDDEDDDLEDDDDEFEDDDDDDLDDDEDDTWEEVEDDDEDLDDDEDDDWDDDDWDDDDDDWEDDDEEEAEDEKE